MKVSEAPDTPKKFTALMNLKNRIPNSKSKRSSGPQTRMKREVNENMASFSVRVNQAHMEDVSVEMKRARERNKKRAKFMKEKKETRKERTESRLEDIKLEREWNTRQTEDIVFRDYAKAPPVLAVPRKIKAVMVKNGRPLVKQLKLKLERDRLIEAYRNK